MNKVPLAKVANFINGRAFKPEEWHTEGLPIIRIQNLTGTSEETNYFNGKYDNKNLIKRGDILISWSASLGVYEWQGKDAILNQHIFKVDLKDSIDKRYFYHAATDLLNEMSSHVHGSTMQHITKDKFDALEIPLPNPDEQKRIAAILDKADRLRRQRCFAQKLSDSFLQSVFVKMFGDPVSNPTNWDTIPLGKIAAIQRGRFSPRPRNDPKFYGGEFPFIQTGDISRSKGFLTDWTQTLNKEGTRVSKAFDIGTIVIAIVGATIGETAILGIKAYCPDSVIGIKVNSRFSNREYIEYLLRFWKPIFRAMAPETARANINLETLRPISVPLPPLQLQEKFASIVQKFERVRRQQREAVRQAEHLFQTLLHRAFRGEL